MKLRGFAHKLGDYVNTDLHASDKYKPLGTTLEDLRRQLFIDLDPSLPERVKPGDILVAGKTFGAGGSRDDAARVLRAAGFSVVMASSFWNLFQRSAINLGLPVLECETSGIETGDELDVDLANGTVLNLTRGTSFQGKPLPPPIQQIVADGGLIPHVQKNGGFSLNSG